MSAIKCLQLCQSFCEQAEWVANTLSRADHLEMAYNEETITENVLLTLTERHAGRDLIIRAYTKPEEGTGTIATNNLPTGADWSFWFADRNNRGIELRIQAKRLFSSGKYESLNGVGGKETQLEWLKNNRGNAIPLYVFYNFHIDRSLCAQKKGFVKWSYPLNFLGGKVWGCTYAPLTSIPKKNKPHYCDIPVMLPWHTLVCECFCSKLDSVNNPKNLPERIAASLAYAYSEMARIQPSQSEKSEHELHFNILDQKLKFEVTENSPKWVNMLPKMDAETPSMGSADDPLTSKLDNYLSKNRLRGVAIIREKPKPD